MKRIYYFIILTSLLIGLIPTVVYSYPSDTDKQNIQQMINRGNPLRQAYRQTCNQTNDAIDQWEEAGRPRTGPIIDEARARLNDENNAKAALQANRDSVIHAVDSLYDTGIPPGTDIGYDPECKDRGYNSAKCYIRICEPGITDGPDRLAGTKIHEWEHQKQKNDSIWGPGNVPPDTSFRRAKMEFGADEAILNADNGNKIKLTIEQKMEILIRKSEHLKHMLDALEAEWKQKSTGALPGGEVREEVTIINNSDTLQLFHCTITDSLGWPVIPQMFTVQLYPEQESTLEVFVQVPPLTEIGTINELFCYAEGMTHSSFDFTMINIVPTVEVVAGPDTHGLRGQIIEVPFTVTNRGETPDIFVVAVTNPLGWPVESFFDISLDTGADTTFTIPIIIPMETPFWTTNIIACEATSFYNPSQHDKGWISVRVDEVDVRPMFIESPIGTYTVGSTVTPRVTVYNNGYVESFFDVYFEVNLPELHRDSVLNLMLPPDHTIDVEFAYVNLPQAGLYPLEFYTIAHMDANPYNDTLTGQFVVEPLVTSAWTQKESMPSSQAVDGKYVKDGGALTAVTGTKDGNLLFAFRGFKSKEFYMYDPEDGWIAKETIPFGYKYPLTDPLKINKKYPGKGAALCFDEDHTIYATKGNGTWEFWAYDLLTDAGWTAKAFVPSTQKIKGGTSMAYKNGLVYLLAGAQKKDNFNNFFAYDPTQDTALGLPWTTLTGAPITPPVTAKPKPFKDGSAISIIGNTIYAIKGGDKFNFFYAYDIAIDIWTEMESIPLVHPRLGKKNKVGDGGAMTTDGSILYVIKGKGKQDFWSYSPIVKGTWNPLDTIPRLHKKSVPKTGAALAYANGAVWLLKGNKTPEFWKYVPTKKMNKDEHKPSTSMAIMTDKTTSILKFNLTVLPNPFTKFTTINYTVPISKTVSLKLYSVTGRVVKTLLNGYVTAGRYTIKLATNRLAKGVYFLRYSDNTNQKELKLIVQ